MRTILFPILILLLIGCNNSTTEEQTTTIPTDNAATITPPTTKADSLPTAPTSDGKPLDAFILDNHKILGQGKGDLNKDGIEDIIIVLARMDEVSEDYEVLHSDPRPLLILLGTDKDNYTLAVRNDKAVYKVDEGGVMGDPFSAIALKDGVFTIEHFGGSAERWSRYSTFRYSDKQKTWLWAKDGTVHSSAHDPDFHKEDYMKVDNRPFSEFDIYYTKDIE